MTQVVSVVLNEMWLKALSGLTVLWICMVWSSTVLIQKLSLLGAITCGKVESHRNHHERIGLPQWPSDKESTCNRGLIPGLGRSPGEGNGNLLQYSYLGNPKDKGAWQAIVHRVEKVRHDLVNKQKQGQNQSSSIHH